MAQQSQFASALVNETMQTFNGNVQTVSPTDGINLIDNWISALHSGDETVNPIAHTLSELKIQLQDGTPNGSAIQSLIAELADQTHQAAQSTDGVQQQSLAQLASALRGFGQSLSGNGSQSDMSRQGDMDDPTGSNGGLMSSDMSAAPMTGSQSVGGDNYGASGAEQQDGGSYGSGYGTGNK